MQWLHASSQQTQMQSGHSHDHLQGSNQARRSRAALREALQHTSGARQNATVRSPERPRIGGLSPYRPLNEWRRQSQVECRHWQRSSNGVHHEMHLRAISHQRAE